MEPMALSLNQRQYVEAVIAALPHLAEVVAAIPPDCQVKAFEAAERSYLRTFRQLGLSGPEAWASSIMRRLRRRVREAGLTERDKLKKLYEQLSANECLETVPGQRHSFDIPDTASSGEQKNIGREGEFDKLTLYQQLSNDEQIGQAYSFDTREAASSEGEFDKLKLHEQLSADEETDQEQKNVGREREFDKLKLREQLSADEEIAQAHRFEMHGAASSGEQKNVGSEGEFDKLKLYQQVSNDEQIAQAHSFEINDTASSGEQKDVGREGAKKGAVALRMTEILINIDEIFDSGRRAGVENVHLRKREQPKYTSDA